MVVQQIEKYMKIEHFRDVPTIDIDELGMLGWNECSFDEDFSVKNPKREISLAEEHTRPLREWRAV